MGEFIKKNEEMAKFPPLQFQLVVVYLRELGESVSRTVKNSAILRPENYDDVVWLSWIQIETCVVPFLSIHRLRRQVIWWV